MPVKPWRSYKSHKGEEGMFGVLATSGCMLDMPWQATTHSPFVAAFPPAVFF